MTKTIVDFEADSVIAFEDLARETGRLIADLVKEHYALYLESIRDRDYD
jgi:hypothetical protein